MPHRRLGLVGGLIAGLILSGGTAANGWRLTFAFRADQHITSAWNATVTQTGAAVAAANLSYNAVIAPGASQSFGVQGTWSASDTSPADFAVNGAPCA